MTNTDSHYIASLEGFVSENIYQRGNAVYSNNYYGLHSKALSNIYPTLKQLLGDSNFQSIALAYIEHYPAEHWDINRYGKDFPELISAQVHSPKKDEQPWELLSYIAQIDWAINEAYYALEDIKLEITAFTPIPFDSQQSSPSPLEQNALKLLTETHRYTVFGQNFLLGKPITVKRIANKTFVDNGSYGLSNAHD